MRQADINAVIMASCAGFPLMLNGHDWNKEHRVLCVIAEDGNQPTDWDALDQMEIAGAFCGQPT